jgi:hypothetical protein
MFFFFFLLLLLRHQKTFFHSGLYLLNLRNALDHLLIAVEQN